MLMADFIWSLVACTVPLPSLTPEVAQWGCAVGYAHCVMLWGRMHSPVNMLFQHTSENPAWS